MIEKTESRRKRRELEAVQNGQEAEGEEEEEKEVQCKWLHQPVHPDWPWKVEWSLRTGLSTALAVGIFLSAGPREVYSFNGYVPAGSSFVGFVTVMVADVTFGRTAINGWGCMLVAFLVSTLTAAVLGASQVYSPAIALPCIAVLTFVFQLLHLPPMGKRLGLSLVALNLIEQVPAAEASGRLWLPSFLLLIHIATGFLIAMVGTIVPWPRLATTELDARARFCARVLAQVIDSLLEGVRGNPAAQSRLFAQHRSEMMSDVRHSIGMCRIRLLESRWGPRRSDALTKDAEMLDLIDESFMSAKMMCDIFEKINFSTLGSLDSVIVDASGPLSNYQRAVVHAFKSVARSPQLETEEKSRLVQDLQQSLAEFEASYFNAREKVFQREEENGFPREEETNTPIDETRNTMYLNALLFELDLLSTSICEFIQQRRVHPLTSRRSDFRMLGEEKPRRCCDDQLAADLFPSQRLLYSQLFPLSKAGKRQLIVAFRMSLSMTLAAVYGFYAYPQNAPQSLPAFTIAYIGTDPVQGSNVTAAVLRAFATTLAAVYSYLVVAAASSRSLVSQSIFIGFATVAFVIPSTYVRATASVSYAGTVAGFTATLLLLATPSDDVYDLSENRILDTYVGTFIFLATEFLILPLRSETQLLDKVIATIGKIQEDFGAFHTTFTDLCTIISSRPPRPTVAEEFSPGNEQECHSPHSATASQEVVLSPRQESALSGDEDVLFLSTPGLFRLAPSFAERISLIEQQRNLLELGAKEPELWRVSLKRQHLDLLLHAEERSVLFGLQLVRFSAFASRAMLSGLSKMNGKKLLYTVTPDIAQLSDQLAPLFKSLSRTAVVLQEPVQRLDAFNSMRPKHWQTWKRFIDLEADGASTFRNEVLDRVGELESHLTQRFHEGVRNAHGRTGQVAVPSNAEVKFVCALMFSCTEFLESLYNLSQVANRAQAGRLLNAKQRPYVIGSNLIRASFRDMVAPFKCASS